ncbi:MAG: hypothetical protein MUC42_07400 [Bryobacter sp.]|jgi:hypothetical protein|nr:hypothetical protein [Bryobacter sp.]
MTIEIAAGCPGIHSYDPKTRRRVTLPVPDEFADFFVPWPWQERVLPVGAYVSLWPDWKGNDWSKVKPDNWSADWRPAAR